MRVAESRSMSIGSCLGTCPRDGGARWRSLPTTVAESGQARSPQRYRKQIKDQLHPYVCTTGWAKLYGLSGVFSCAADTYDAARPGLPSSSEWTLVDLVVRGWAPPHCIINCSR